MTRSQRVRHGAPGRLGARGHRGAAVAAGRGRCPRHAGAVPGAAHGRICVGARPPRRRGHVAAVAPSALRGDRAPPGVGCRRVGLAGPGRRLGCRVLPQAAGLAGVRSPHPVPLPPIPEEPFRPEFGRFPWQDDPAGLAAWEAGATGFPLVDAGHAPTLAEGWMHNRVRMVVGVVSHQGPADPMAGGSRLVLGPLVDADLANNTLGWQWTAGSGPDAAPYFRVFNPVAAGPPLRPPRCLRPVGGA